MSTTEIMNGRITETRLGEEHGCLSADLTIEGDGWGCGFGGYVLAHWFGTNKPTCGAGAIAELLKTLDLEKWEQLRGTYVRAKLKTMAAHPAFTITAPTVARGWI